MRISDWSSDVCSSDLTARASSRWARVTPLRGFIEAPISSVDIHISPSDIAGKPPLVRVDDLDVGPEMLDGRLHLSGEATPLGPVAGGGGGLQSRRRLRQRQCADPPRRALDPELGRAHV